MSTRTAESLRAIIRHSCARMEQAIYCHRLSNDYRELIGACVAYPLTRPVTE